MASTPVLLVPSAYMLVRHSSGRYRLTSTVIVAFFNSLREISAPQTCFELLPYAIALGL